MNKFEYKNLTPFKWFVLENFPFIEADFDALTEWQLFCKLGKEMNKIINSENILGTQMENVTKAFIELQNYVNNYFKNLDVQDEINNKLNQMSESGELQNIIGEFLKLNSLITFNNVEKMKNSQNLIDGSFAQTLGFYYYNDGGSGTYKIREIKNTDIVDNCTIIPLSYNNLIAELIIENSTISVNQFGAHGNGIDDDTNAIQKCIDYCTSHNLTCFFNNQTYLTSSPLIIKETSVLCGGVTNDEYYKQTVIKNITSNMIDITSHIVGAHIKNLCFESDISKNLYFLNNENYALEWCEISNCGFRKFYKVFNANTLGCRFEKLWINYGKSVGKLSGSDNTFIDSFVSAPEATGENLLDLSGYSLSRFDNIYFTGKTDTQHGNNTILNIINGYCSNLSFNGCYFDFSDGSAINILGQGVDFPRSGATNISFNNCLFRGNCCNQNEVTHIINADYCRNINIINCSFKTQDRYTVNANAKIYNLGQYSQGVMLLNNYYETPFSSNGIYINNASMIEPYGPSHFNNLGYNYYDNTMFLQNSAGTKKIFHKKQTVTTGETYGEAIINFTESMGDSPIVTVSVENGVFIATINQITSNNVQIIVRKAADGTPVTNANVTIDVIAISA